jgi:hypothetical protein
LLPGFGEVLPLLLLSAGTVSRLGRWASALLALLLGEPCVPLSAADDVSGLPLRPAVLLLQVR